MLLFKDVTLEEAQKSDKLYVIVPIDVLQKKKSGVAASVVKPVKPAKPADKKQQVKVAVKKVVTRKPKNQVSIDDL